MEFIMKVCGAMLLVAGAIIALTIASMCAYATVVFFKSIIDDHSKKKSKKKKAKK